MQIEKAIEILEARTQSRPLLGKHEVYGAIHLGIEALKRIITSRHSKHHNYKRRLPGETE